VTLADLRHAPIIGVEAGAVRTTEQVYPLDVLVLATGFDAITGALLAMDIRGRGGLPLRDAWAAGPRSYLGLSVAGFPNLFTITGPLSPSVLANMPTAVEQHVDWIAQCLSHMRDAKLDTVEATTGAEAAWVEHTADVVAHTLYSGSSSWYSGANIPGKPRRFGVYLGGFSNYRERCEAVAQQGYEGFRFAEAGAV
jgi:cyclohexanone monooxygenase